MPVVPLDLLLHFILLVPWCQDSMYLKIGHVLLQKLRLKVGSARARKTRALSSEERWLQAHKRHLSVMGEAWDVIFYGDDLVEAWRWGSPPCILGIAIHA